MMRFLITAFLAAALVGPAPAQRVLSGTPQIKQALEKLTVLGSVMMVAAHPDDENNALLVYLARGKKYRTSYLAVTRGEGGQNLIGSEQGDEIGLIRTHELVGARKVDGGEQYFARAVDFGFSKSPQEAFAKWGREDVLGDIVWNIRRYRPDIIINRFSGTARDGHGHHTASGLLTKDAYEAAADPKRFPEQLKYVQPWRAKRIMFNLFAFGAQMEAENAKVPDKVEIEVGAFDPVLGYSYNEIAGMSRSSHRSQAFGSAERKGSQKAHLITTGGDPAKTDIFDGVDTTWNRVAGGARIGQLLARANAEFKAEAPATVVPLLMEARQLAAANQDWWAQYKLEEIDEAIALCSSLFAELVTDKEQVPPGGSAKLTANVILRSKAPLKWTATRLEPAGAAIKTPGAPLPDNAFATASADWTVPADHPLSQPYWLREPRKNGQALFTVSDQRLVGLSENPPVMAAVFEFTDDAGRKFQLRREARYRFIDQVEGEQSRRLVVVPPVAVKVTEPVLIFPDAKPRVVAVEVKANTAKAGGKLRLRLPEGWSAAPADQPFSIADRGEVASYKFTVTPPSWSGKANLDAEAVLADGRVVRQGTEIIKYPHIPVQTTFPQAQASAVKIDVKVHAKRVGYVMGSGDEVPGALRQLGLEVDLLSADDLASGDLARYDAIVTGVRAFATRADLRAAHARLMEYVNNGGTMVCQYNVAERGGPFGRDTGALNKLGPYPLKIGGDRVTVEEAPVKFVDRQNPLLNQPNKITGEDFDGWVQERGLYFASEWDPQYQPLFGMNDPNEKESLGSTLVAKYGKGVYIYTSLSWFRQLPAGVPGAYRIFANFLSGGK